MGFVLPARTCLVAADGSLGIVELELREGEEPLELFFVEPGLGVVARSVASGQLAPERVSDDLAAGQLAERDGSSVRCPLLAAGAERSCAVKKESAGHTFFVLFFGVTVKRKVASYKKVKVYFFGLVHFHFSFRVWIV
jgi:hypothetical protein